MWLCTRELFWFGDIWLNVLIETDRAARSRVFCINPLERIWAFQRSTVDLLARRLYIGAIIEGDRSELRHDSRESKSN